MNALLLPAVLTSALVAQQADLRSRLIERGAAPAFAREVVRVAAQARAEGLPVEPLADKAFEGLAKGISSDRILPVVQGLANRLRAGQATAVFAGLAHPPGAVVAAAAEALGRGIERQDIIDVLRTSHAPGAGGVGLTVAASLVAQGIHPQDAAHAVELVYREGHSPQELLELPSVTSSWLSEGMQMPEVLKRIREGQGLPFPPEQGGSTVRPPGLSPGRGPPINPPGKSGNRLHKP